MKNIFVIAFSITISTFCIKAQHKPFQESLNMFGNDPSMQNASWGFCLMNCNTGQVISEANSNISLTPASTLKLVTTIAALKLLGKDYRYKTKLEYEGNIDLANGILYGNLIITGGGDPTLNSEHFKKNDDKQLTDKWAKILKEKGIKRIEGSIIADETIFEKNPVPSGWIWADIGNYYGAGAYGLSYNDNLYKINFQSKQAGGKTQILSTDPPLPYINFINEVTAGGTEDNAYIYGAPYTNYRYISGTIPPDKNNFVVKGSLPDPAWFCAQSLLTSIKNIGISVSGYAVTLKGLKEGEPYKERERKTLYTHYSPPLDSIVFITNTISNNLYVEHLLKTLSMEKNGKGTLEGGIKEVGSLFEKLGIDRKGFFMEDGSGLSRSNAITTKQLTQLLRLISTDSIFTSLYNSLPIAGKTGTLSTFLKNSKAENNMRAKSGSMERIRAYSGYYNNSRGELMSFTLIINNYNGSSSEIKKKIEILFISMVEML